jgi:hypothetical protein
MNTSGRAESTVQQSRCCRDSDRDDGVDWGFWGVVNEKSTDFQ